MFFQVLNANQTDEIDPKHAHCHLSPLILGRSHHNIGCDRRDLRQYPQVIRVKPFIIRQIRTFDPQQILNHTGSPMTFLQAAAFQWVTPKAWAMALTVITVYVGEAGLTWLAVGAAIFAVVNLPSVSIWTIAGQQLQRFLTSPSRLRAYNWTMAALLIASLYPVLGISQ